VSAELYDAAMVWWRQKAGPYLSDEEHALQPCLNLFGPEETVLAGTISMVVRGIGSMEQVRQAALDWNNSVRPPSSGNAPALEVIQAALSTASEDAPTEGAVMHCHKVTLKGKCERYAGTGLDAKWFRDTFIETFGCTKKEVTIEQVEIPTAKDDLIEFVNDLLTRIDEETSDEK
jgi:hypothetical protein